jgi:hypothetical protein
MDDDLFTRLRAVYGDDELVDLAICCAAFLGLGRVLAVLDIQPVVDAEASEATS